MRDERKGRERARVGRSAGGERGTECVESAKGKLDSGHENRVTNAGHGEDGTSGPGR